MMDLAALLTTLKANYGAKVGQAIAGQLGRGQGGRFAKVGSGAGAAPAAGGGGKRAAVLKKTGVPEKEAAELDKFLAGGEVDGDMMFLLFERGLVDMNADGEFTANAAGKKFARAVKRGNGRDAADALSAGADRAKKQDAKKAPKATKPAKSGGGKGGAADKPKAERNPAKDAETAQRVGDRLDVLEAQVKSSQMNEATRVSAMNRLDKAERDLKDLAIDDGEKAAMQERIGKTRAALEKRIAAGDAPIPIRKEFSEFTVIKQGSEYRWVVVSSNAFKDREGEIVSEKALAADVDRMDADGQYGPLRWWHVGDVAFNEPGNWQTAQAGEGMDIGTCDFAALHDRMLIESGTFKAARFGDVDLSAEQIAQAVAANAANLQVSRGFAKPMDEPVDGVYWHIKGVERSLLPKGTAANAFTSVSVQEVKDMATLKEKWGGFVKLFNGDANAAKEFAAEVTNKSAELEAGGVAFKEGDAPAATVEAKAEGDMPAAEAETEDIPETVGDMTIDEVAAAIVASPAFIDSIAGMMSKGLEPIADTVAKALAAQTETATKEADDVKALKETAAALELRLKSLEGDAPAGTPGFVASTDSSTVSKEVKLPTKEEPDRLYQFFVGGKS